MSPSASKRRTGEPACACLARNGATLYAFPVATRARYRQVADVLAQRIVSGEIPVGDRMPGKRLIAEAEGVSVQTVEKSLRILAGWGLVESSQGVGVFVISREPQFTPGTDERLAALETDVDAIKRHLGMK